MKVHHAWIVAGGENTPRKFPMRVSIKQMKNSPPLPFRALFVWTLICLAGGSPLRVFVSAGGLMVRKQITKKVKGAEKGKGFQKCHCHAGEKTECGPCRYWIRGEAYLLSPLRQRRVLYRWQH
jgi:hypothetical protein